MDYGLTPLRVRGLTKLALHADLVMLARLSQALARARAVPLAGVASGATPARRKHGRCGNRRGDSDPQNHRPGLVTPTLDVLRRHQPESIAATDERDPDQQASD
jgi:hypothetical protein